MSCCQTKADYPRVHNLLRRVLSFSVYSGFVLAMFTTCDFSQTGSIHSLEDIKQVGVHFNKRFLFQRCFQVLEANVSELNPASLSFLCSVALVNLPAFSGTCTVLIRLYVVYK